MLDYVRWVFKLDCHTLRYLILRELELEKLKIIWGLKAIKFEERIRDKEKRDLLKVCWREKTTIKNKDLCVVKKRGKYYNRNS